MLKLKMYLNKYSFIHSFIHVFCLGFPFILICAKWFPMCWFNVSNAFVISHFFKSKWWNALGNIGFQHTKISEINEIFIYNFFAFFLIQNNTHLCYKRFCNIPVSIKKGNDKISDFNKNSGIFFLFGLKS